MEKGILKDSLFGYSKSEVCAYIARMNEEFSQRLLVKDEEYAAKEAELREQIIQLQEENKRLAERQEEISDALLDAKLYASQLKAKAEAENQMRRAENAARNAEEYRRIQSVAANIDSIREVFRSMIEKMDLEVKEYQKYCDEIREKLEDEENGFRWKAEDDALLSSMEG